MGKWKGNPKYKERIKAAPIPTHNEAAAITKYSGGSYSEWNNNLRSSFGEDPGSFSSSNKELKAYLDKASFPEDGIVSRRVSDSFAKYLIKEAMSHSKEGGTEHSQYTFVDHGYASSDHWSGSLTIKIAIPKGAKAAAIGHFSAHPSEDEILIQAGSKYRIDAYDPKTNTMKATLIRSGEDLWHTTPK